MRAVFLVLMILLGSVTGTSAETVQEANAKLAWEAAARTGKAGPVEVPLLDQGTLKVPQGLFFIPTDAAAQLLRAFGNTAPRDLVGLVVSNSDDAEWFTTVRFIKEGYIKDDDAKNWNADELISNIRAATDEANKRRADQGFRELEIIGWAEKPKYDERTHRLVWSLMSRDKGFADLNKGSANYNTYALGRDGYFSLNLVTTNERVEKEKPIAAFLLGSMAYHVGKRYEDFVASTDRVAEYGLAALVGGLAAKKLGLFAVIAAFAAKFAKLLLVVGAAVVFGIVGALKRIFSRPSSSA